MLKSIWGCIFGTLADEQLPPADRRSSESIASDIVTIILNADTCDLLQKQLKGEMYINGWSEAIAEAILHGLENAIKAGTEMAQAAAEAAAKSKDAAIGFMTEHPMYATLIALGILALLTPWALEILGFGELGPIEGSWAAAWQSRWYGGRVLKGDLFGYFQRLGMKWHWTF
ncbi:unnamed protein product [Penicillium nalgiovense]|uniref:Uncharacterized protein n=1 Tax=Penicillium nalgiovense TaxID=60175 RepID=A0A9W4HDF9_PENNA|nr:unnamed protein product [Penicillium nalgiovense]CAG7952188.1 unnamed protein product [Penicillium nalgiovense]CAG7962326.1 unnamed protein product [Penicillium nalgiovense]CAG7962681.1 unnamed protein product [Penicillium nalgiovense]CAG7992811.1 unnamed protein product [Penicillium nalgiovense]